jgi:hypothetical protein
VIVVGEVVRLAVSALREDAALAARASSP